MKIAVVLIAIAPLASASAEPLPPCEWRVTPLCQEAQPSQLDRIERLLGDLATRGGPNKVACEVGQIRFIARSGDSEAYREICVPRWVNEREIFRRDHPP